MTNMNKNYYTILGVSESCSEQELKSAYRKLARLWHPDVAGNSEDTVAKFKEINEAYETLSNKVKRAEYDTINRYYNYSSSKQTQTKKTNNSTKPDFKNTKTQNNKNDENKTSKINFNWEEFLSKYREYTKKHEENINKNENTNYGTQKKGKDINTDVEITIAEAINGTTKVINMLNTHVCQYCSGRKFINGTTCPHCKGKGESSDYKRFSVKIPSGIKDNSKIRLAGEGEKGINGGSNGDLYITVHIKAPLDYKTEGNNILKTITLAPFEAVVKISPNTQNGQKIRLSGCGINVNGKIGDMILTVEIQIPKNLSFQEIELYKKLQEYSSQNIR